ncbi:MAG: LacI family DNA-binding transcriptional regulator [Lentisphaeria bacterium]|nr:LacI family DNA-binding transcriptional regulator [Lentisphaeria bacterium]
MKVTMDDIAKLSGVSKATVSFVLNQKRSSLGLSSRTVMKVLETSHKLNYRPDAVAVALSQQKNLPLTLLILSPWLYSQFSDFMAQVNHTLSALSVELPLKASYELFYPGLLQKVLTPSRSSKFDVVLVLGTASEDHLFLQKKQHNFTNIVLLNRDVAGYCCSYGNDHEACCSMADRIFAGGYYRRCVLGCCKRPSHSEEKRIRGFMEGLQKNNATFEHCDLDAELSPEQQVMELFALHRPDTPSLFFLPQYYPAALLLKLFLKNGVAVPEQAGIACYDCHSLLSNFLQPELTTIDPDIATMTRHAVAIAQQIKAGERGENCISNGVFVPGGTTIL